MATILSRPCGWVLIVCSLFVNACSVISPDLQREQKSDAVTSAGNLAMTAVRATAGAAVRQPITTVKLGISVLWNRPQATISATLPSPQLAQTIEPIPGSMEFESMLDHAGCPSAEQGTLKWLVDGPMFFPELERQMQAARHSIGIQVFIFDNDDIAVRTADQLRERAKEVPVRVLFDDLGTNFAHRSAPETPAPEGFVMPGNMRRYLSQGSKLQARRSLNPWLVCDHTKLFLFDERVALLGGMNVGREYYSEWHDLMAKVEGPVVHTLSQDFKRAWMKAGPLGDFTSLFHRPQHRPPSADQGFPMRVLRTDPAAGRYEIRDSILLAIRGAQERIWIQNPYFAFADLVNATAAAAERGVDVRVIIPKRGDSTLMDAANTATANRLIHAGAKVYQYPLMTHMKVMICDDWVTFGSANFDTLCMQINRELNLAFRDKTALKELEQLVFVPDFRRSKRLKVEDTERALNPIIGIVTDQL